MTGTGRYVRMYGTARGTQYGYSHAFSSPSTSGVAWHDLLTVSLGGVGTITHVINSTGAVTASNTTPSNVVSYP